MSALRRTMAAGFTLDQAVTIEEVQREGASLLMDVDQLFEACPPYQLQREREEFFCLHGNPIPADLPPGTYRVYSRSGQFLCLSRWERGKLVSIKNFFGA